MKMSAKIPLRARHAAMFWKLTQWFISGGGQIDRRAPVRQFVPCCSLVNALTMGNSAPKPAGFQVLFVHPHSPAEEAGLVPYFDFILIVDGVSLVSKLNVGGSL